MICVYFSGTGNTKYCAERFLKALGETVTGYSIEDENVRQAVGNCERLIFAYPVYYSALPKIVFDFITQNAALWKGKKIFILCTMGLFSGDGAGVSARLFRRYGASVLGGLHVKMPDCIGDVKLLKKPLSKNRKIVAEANKKISRAARRISAGAYPQNGLGMFDRLAGLFFQRLYFGGKTKRYYGGIKADPHKCVGCGACVSLCPMGNISVAEKGVRFAGKCTMCYRCFANCPQKAITVIGKRVYDQNKLQNYL